jgi:YceI-like domain
MRNSVSKKGKIPGVALFFFLLFSIAVSGQTKYQNPGAAKVSIEGTSNIHDWVMNSEKGTCNALFTMDGSNTLTAVSNILFSMTVETLKSEHKAMDKNTYKAMNTDKFPNIVFNASGATVKAGSGGSYTVTAHGKLTITSVTKEIELVTNCTVNADKSITCTGSYKFKISEYNVKPPSIMFGMIKVGDGITVKFNFILKP